MEFSTHTGYKHIKGKYLKSDEIEEVIEGLILNKVDYYTHFLTGYSGLPDILKKIPGIITKLRERNPNLVYGKFIFLLL